jgi:hypothetical protein
MQFIFLLDCPDLELAVPELPVRADGSQPLRDVRPVPSHRGSRRLCQPGSDRQVGFVLCPEIMYLETEVCNLKLKARRLESTARTCTVPVPNHTLIVKKKFLLREEPPLFGCSLSIVGRSPMLRMCVYIY